MNNLKSAIANKILDISSTGGDDVKQKLEKVNRFRDFVDACQSLIIRYPAIEEELMRMIQNNDFDTKVASSRVDTIIRLSEKDPTNIQQNSIIEKDIDKLEEITQQVDNEAENNNELHLLEKVPHYIDTSDKPKLLPEDTDYEIVNNNEVDKEKDIKEYTPFEEVASDEKLINNNQEDATKSSKLDTAKKIMIAVGVITSLILVYFIYKFITKNWSTIRWILGIMVVISIAGWYFFKKNKSTNQ